MLRCTKYCLGRLNLHVSTKDTEQLCVQEAIGLKKDLVTARLLSQSSSTHFNIDDGNSGKAGKLVYEIFEGEPSLLYKYKVKMNCSAIDVLDLHGCSKAKAIKLMNDNLMRSRMDAH